MTIQRTRDPAHLTFDMTLYREGAGSQVAGEVGTFSEAGSIGFGIFV